MLSKSDEWQGRGNNLLRILEAYHINEYFMGLMVWGHTRTILLKGYSPSHQVRSSVLSGNLEFEVVYTTLWNNALIHSSGVSKGFQF